jgi:hypothetical protein
MSDYERTKMYEDIIARLEQQNANLAEENLAAHLVNKEFADEVRELRTAFEASRTVSEAQKAMCETFTADNVRLFKELQHYMTLAEERRVALVKAMETSEWCYACKEFDIHANNCDYIRLIKGDDNGN